MQGLTTRTSREVTTGDTELAFYSVKRVSGETVPPHGDAINSIACFGDASVATSEPDRLAVDAAGRRATADHPRLDWPVVCPTDEDYREALLSTVDRCTGAAPALRLTTVGFPTGEFCHCERCQRRFADSSFEDRQAWRTSVVTGFVATVADRVPGELYLTVHPDPSPGALRDRAGLDLAVLDDVVDAVVVPLCDPRYETTYWLETIVRGFERRLTSPVVVQLLATEDNRTRLDAATACVEPYADHVVYGGDSDVVRSVLSATDGETATGEPTPSQAP